jgi:hypothetical protein
MLRKKLLVGTAIELVGSRLSLLLRLGGQRIQFTRSNLQEDYMTLERSACLIE